MDGEQSQGKRKRVEEESTEGASTSSFISLVPTTQGGDQYDVFLSFRGLDTRKKFTDHLYHRLVNTGIVPVSVFKDDNSIPIGEEFGSQILSAISRSKISIPIISKNYATSKWCLRELIYMTACKNSMSHIVLPIFYEVKPSDVRYLKGSFGDAFRSSQKHLNEKDILEGQRALNEVSFLHGWESEKFANGFDDGKDAQFAMYMWEDCGFYPNQGIEELKLRCLIKIGLYGEFMVHDQLRDLGRSIFCQGQSLEKCRGPWDDNYEGVPRVVRDPQRRPWFHDFLGAASSGDSKFSEVRWLQWDNPGNDASLSTINFHLPNLSVLCLWEGEEEESEEDWEGITEESEEDREGITEEREEDREGITENWEGWNSFRASKQLKVLSVQCCHNLRCTPDLSAFTRLKILLLNYCDGLEHLHPSIGELTSLVTLDLCFCSGLKELPEEVGGLKDLEKLLLNYSRITAIPSSIGSLRKLKTLSAFTCESLREIPSSIGDLRNLQHLNLRSTAIEKLPSAIGGLKNLQYLDLFSCSSLKGAIPSEIGDLPSLKKIFLYNTLISDLPESVRNLSSLKILFLSDCKELRSLPELPSSLQSLDLVGCYKLQSLPELPLGLTHLSFTCQRLGLPQLLRFIHLETLYLEVRHLLEDICKLSSITLKLCFEEWDKLTSLSLRGLTHLEELSIKKCNSIKTLGLSGFIHLKRLRIEHCDSLVKIRGCDNLESLEVIFLYFCKCLKEFKASGCSNLIEIQGLDGAKSLEELDFTGCKSMETLPDLTGCEKL